jgi:transposase
MFSAPLEGWRHVEAQEHRTRVDWAYRIDDLLTNHFPSAYRIRLVMDNLNTHTKGSLYQAFLPQKALKLARRLEIHYTPKHGSWLNMAEIELSVLTMQCLNRRIKDTKTLKQEISAWERARNSAEKNIDWQFTTNNARDKLKRLYPCI